MTKTEIEYNHSSLETYDEANIKLITKIIDIFRKRAGKPPAKSESTMEQTIHVKSWHAVMCTPVFDHQASKDFECLHIYK